MFEVLVETILAGSLNRVTNKGGTPASKDSTDAFSTSNQTPRLEVALVQVRIDLSTTFDQIERGDSSMRGALD